MKLAANLFAALAVLVAAQMASAQSGYPNRPVKILVGFTPGTAPDLAARILADRFSEVWGTPFVVENIPGAGSNIATERVAKATADGYTLLMGGNPSLVINPSLYETCLLYTSDAADEEDSVDLGGRRIIKKKKKK